MIAAFHEHRDNKRRREKGLRPTTRNAFAHARPADEHDEPPLRVLLADPHAMFLSGLARLLEHLGLDVVAQATSEEAALALAGEQEPDVILVDIGSPAMSGAATVRRLIAASPAARVIVLSEYAELAYVAEAVIAGASAYLLKGSSVKALLTCVHAAASTRSLILPQEAAALLEAAPAARPPEQHELSQREIEVLRLIAAGRDNGEIAAELFISPATAKSHVARILEKLKTENRVQAAVFAVRAGLVETS